MSLIQTRSECSSRMEHDEIPKETRGNRERSLRTDVDEVALAVQHDVSIVSVFDLQQEEQQAVSCHAADEIVSRLEFGKTGEILSPDRNDPKPSCCWFTFWNANVDSSPYWFLK